MKNCKPYICVFFLIAALSGCDDTAPVTKAAQPSTRYVGGLSEDFGLTRQQVRQVDSKASIANQPAVSIMAGSNDQNLLEIKLLQSSIRRGYRAQSTSFNHPEISLRVMRQGQVFVQSTAYPTYATVAVEDVTPDQVVIYVKGKLINPQNGQPLWVPPTVIRVKGEYLKALRVAG